MEVMEEGNLLDRVHILLQRDLDYYEKHQTVLQETLCSGVVGGLLDFPRYASFAAVKLVTWWEELFVGTFRRSSGLVGSASSSNGVEDLEGGCGGIVATSAPSDFVKIISDTASQLLEHLHVLSQEALDHADLTVLTATLGAAALVKNCLWCFNDQLSKEKDEWNLHDSYKMYQEMAEALAERLLDLHCRLLSLYVLQDADSLNWDHPQPFFEGERGSFTVQMWWVYMQGARQDLWASVPPRTAQRVLSGMLNDTLTIFACRYNQAAPKAGRTNLLITDICNILMCVNEILPCICNDASELVGVGENKLLKDIHAKCHQLLLCLTLRGASLATLYKVFHHGLDNVRAFDEMACSTAPWMLSVCHELRDCFGADVLPEGHSIFLEMKVLTAHPQPSYTLLLKVLCMHDYKVTNLLLRKIVPELLRIEPVDQVLCSVEPEKTCQGFLCSQGTLFLLNETDRLISIMERFLKISGDCSKDLESSYDGVAALVSVVTMIGTVNEISKHLVPVLELTGPGWALCLDRHQVWNLRRPSWLSAILNPLEGPLLPLATGLIAAAASGSSVADLVDLALSGLVRLVEILPVHVFRTAAVLQEYIPADIKPLGKSVLTQLLISVIYALLAKSKRDEVTALGEALCHLRVPIAVVVQLEDVAELYLEQEQAILSHDFTVSNVLSTHAGRQALKAAYQCIKKNEVWLVNTVLPSLGRVSQPNKLLHMVFHISDKPFDQIMSGKWSPDYQAVLERPLSLSRETAWLHLSHRFEFTPEYQCLPGAKHDKAVVDNLTQLFCGIN